MDETTPKELVHLDTNPTLPLEVPTSPSISQPIGQQTPPMSVTPISTETPTQETTPQRSSKRAAILALIFAIASLVLGILWIIATPLAIAALIIGIISLVKKKSGKGMTIAAVIISSLTLLLLPIWIGLTLAVYNGITKKANDLAMQTQEQSQKAEAGDAVDAACFTFKAPKGYILSDDSNLESCRVAVTPPKGDSLTLLSVVAYPGEIISLDDMVTKLKDSVKKAGSSVDESKQIKVNGADTVLIRFKDSYGLERSSYYIIDTTGKHSYSGQTITAYAINAYSYNEYLNGQLKVIVDSFKIKS